MIQSNSAFVPKIKKFHPEAKIFLPAKPGDVGCDICSVPESQPDKNGVIHKTGSIDKYGNICYYTGIGVELPEHPDPNKYYYTLGLMKSSGSKYELILANCVGVIDSGYRGEIIFKLKPTSKDMYDLFTRSMLPGNNIFRFIADFIGVDTIPTDAIIPAIGEPVGQLIFGEAMKIQSFDFVEKLTETERGAKGYGESTKERV